MYSRPHHQKIARVLEAMNAQFLREARCYFGGGTAIALLLDEYRESIDVDFLCADQQGYRKLRTSVFDHGLSELFATKIEMLREIRADRDGIRTVLLIDGDPIKFEIVREARIALEGETFPAIPVPCLSRVDLFAEKLLANADRFADKSVMSRDAIDLLMMVSHWGPIPQSSWSKAEKAYGDSVHVALDRAEELLRADPRYLDSCLAKMDVKDEAGARIREHLATNRRRTAATPRRKSHDRRLVPASAWKGTRRERRRP